MRSSLVDLAQLTAGLIRTAQGRGLKVVSPIEITDVLPAAEPVAASDVFMVSGFGKGRYLNIESSATSAANLEWYVREFIERGGHYDDPFGYCNQLVAETEPAADDPMFHPFLYEARPGSEMRAGFHGISGWHTAEHMLRALYEGAMFEHRQHIEVLTAAGVRFDDVILSGGERAVRSGRKYSPTDWASRSPSPPARKPARWARPLLRGVVPALCVL